MCTSAIYSCPDGLVVDPDASLTPACSPTDFSIASERCCMEKKRSCGEALAFQNGSTRACSASWLGDGCNGTEHGGECQFTCQTHVHEGANLTCNDGEWEMKRNASSNASAFAYCKPRALYRPAKMAVDENDPMQ